MIRSGKSRDTDHHRLNKTTWVLENKIATGAIAGGLLAAVFGAAIPILLQSPHVPTGSIEVVNNYGVINARPAGPVKASTGDRISGSTPGGVPPLPPRTTRTCPVTALPPLGRHSANPTIVRMYVERAPGSGCWTTNTTVRNFPGTMSYLLGYRNTSNTTQRDVVVRFSLAPTLLLVSSTTTIADEDHPHGLTITSNNATGGGINIGTYPPGAVAWVSLDIATPFPNDMACGANVLRSVGGIQPQGLDVYFNTAEIKYQRQC